MSLDLAIGHLRQSNPWSVIVSRNLFIHPADERQIHAHNDHCKNSTYKIITDILPEPFVGSPNAPIWLLNLNPGFVERDRLHSDEVKVAQCKNLVLEADDFWYLDSAYSNTPGHEWWTKRLGPVVDLVGSKELVRKSLFCIEYFPYHSVRYKELSDRTSRYIPTQEFTWNLIRAGIRDKKIFIVMRSRRRWIESVRELETIQYHELKNPRCAYLSSKNCEFFDGLCKYLRSLNEW